MHLYTLAMHFSIRKPNINLFIKQKEISGANNTATHWIIEWQLNDSDNKRKQQHLVKKQHNYTTVITKENDDNHD